MQKYFEILTEATERIVETEKAERNFDWFRTKKIVSIYWVIFFLSSKPIDFEEHIIQRVTVSFFRMTT